MKMLFRLVVMGFLCCNIAKAQVVDSIHSAIKGIINDRANAYRIRADNVFSEFKVFDSSRLLYIKELSEKDLYSCYAAIEIKAKDEYVEFFLILDSLGVVRKVFYVKNTEESKKYLQKLFLLKKYHKKYVKSVPNATNEIGPVTYFAIKDSSDNRYGEFCLLQLTEPNPIDYRLYVYLIEREAELTNKWVNASNKLTKSK
ncbi:MAG: hypothetical protein ACK5IJ_06995 [Mangrovibacterium sp.]